MSQKTKPSPPKLSEVARHISVPDGIVSSEWPAVHKTCKTKLGITFDSWQEAIGRLILTKRADGKLACTIDGVGMSLPRQVGKTYLLAGMVFALCVNRPGLLVIWTAHHMATSSETFLAMQGFAQRAKVAPHVRQVYTGSGDEEIRFHNGSRILFGARERGFGRGIPGVDVLIFDEAQILSDKAMSNMLATMNTSSFGLHLYIGTPPKPEDMSESFSSMRDASLAGKLPNGAWVEFGADETAKSNDRKQWKIANPSYPHRTPAESMLRLQSKLTDDDWRREGLGIWDKKNSLQPLIAANKWHLLGIDPAERPAGKLIIGVKYSIDGGLVGLSAAVKPFDKGTPIHVDGLRVASTAEGNKWIVDWCKQRRTEILQIVIDGKGSDGVLVRDLTDAGFKPRTKVKLETSRFIRIPTLDGYMQAHALFHQMVLKENLTHGEGTQLTTQLVGSIRRPVGNKGGWGWQAIQDTDNTALLDAATLAFWGATTCTRRATARTGGR